MPKRLEVERDWYIANVEGKVLGGVVSKIAGILQGKHKPTFSKHVDVGDFVVVINAEKIKITGNKFENKIYRHYSGYPGGMKETAFKELLKKHPEDIISHAVRGMLPNNKLGKKMLKKLRVYSGEEHSHKAQKPKELKW